MNNQVRKKLVAMAVLMLAVGTAACSAGSQTTSKSSSSVAQNTEMTKTSYRKALTDLQNGAPQQAYHELEKVVEKGAADRKTKELYYSLKTLLAAKKAVTANQLETAAAKLEVLEQVKTPQSLVKQIKAVKSEYQAVKLAKMYYNETIAYYKAARYSEAGGSLEMLLALPGKYQAVVAYQEKGKQYSGQIASAQSKATSTSSASATSAANSQSSGYTNARSSKIVSSEYKQKTGSSISSATNSQVSSVAEGLSDSEILGKFRSVTGIPQEAGDQYYVKKLADHLYQIEIRHTSPSNTSVSNLKGMYKYDYGTGTVEKMNEISGEYSRIN
ncbi:hypothetical protein [Liquorilactobacillus satsumensis]|uniref:hypothetical protein n=1 Tax=Liquorilactobacillus satsumensis TaxID=259059 RepID=UPI0021C36735|nr:hypothetical protein [Liquorilactobacillus satsumensis]MCP9329573.1 hypothetical protein [Liquorilactobacillus satsumensis]